MLMVRHFTCKRRTGFDSAIIENWKANFQTPVCDDNEMFSIMLKDWRRPFSFFTDNQNVSLEGDAQNPNAIMVKGSPSQDRLNAFNDGFNALDAKLDSISQLINDAKKAGDEALAEELKLKYDDAEVIEKMYCFDYVWENPTDITAHYVLYRYKWAFGSCEMRTMIDNIHAADSTLTSSNLDMATEYVERLSAYKPVSLSSISPKTMPKAIR